MPQTIAAEIKVNRTKILNNQGEAYGTAGQGTSHSDGGSQPTSKSVGQRKTSSSPIKPKYDTGEEDGLHLNSNQKKSYNKQHQFFTKPLGPGHYEPTLDLTKPKNTSVGWAANKGKREGIPNPALKPGQQGPPGPGEYNYKNNTIDHRQIPNLDKKETVEDKRRYQLNFKNLSKKLTVEAGNDTEKQKQDLHLKRKSHF